MFVEYDWTFNVYRFRFGQTFTSFRGWQSLPNMADVKSVLAQADMKLGKKTDTRTWAIETA